MHWLPAIEKSTMKHNRNWTILFLYAALKKTLPFITQLRRKVFTIEIFSTKNLLCQTKTASKVTANASYTET
jgi:hypothetical protein